MSPFFFILLQFAILAYALVGGVFLAFSDFIMRSLSLTGGVGGVEAMQVINREVFRWVFMALFLGMAAVSLLVAVYGGIFVGGGSGTIMMIAGLVVSRRLLRRHGPLQRADERGAGRHGPVVRGHARVLDRHLPAALDLLEYRPDACLRCVVSASAVRTSLGDTGADAGRLSYPTDGRPRQFIHSSLLERV